MPESFDGRDDHLSLLTGAEVGDLLDAALEPAGGRLVRWSMRDVDNRPGDRTTASYTATVAWADGEREETFGASVSNTEPTGGLVVTDGDEYVQVWRFPFDPELPTLPAACYPSTAAELLAGLGFDTAGLSLRVVAYRPRKRAVVEVTTVRGRYFLKVLRPRLVADVDRRHRLLTAANVPVPRSLGWSDDGLIVLETLRGTSMRTVLGRDVLPLLRPDDLVELLDRLPAEVRELPHRRPWSDHVAHYAEIVAAAVPDRGGHVRSLASDVESIVRAYPAGDEPTHGDFYDGQLFVADGALTGLLDIDTLGPGRRADDLGCMLAHLSVLTTIEEFSAGARRALEHWRPAFESRVEPRELCARAAGVVMSLATGPYRVQQAGWEAATMERIALVERWLDAAG